MQLTGAQALIKSLEMEQVEVMFGLPGGAILPVYDPIIDSSIRHIPVRHAQRAGHIAECYAQAEMDWYWPTDADVAADLPGYKPTTKGHARMIKEAARVIGEARQPVLYV